MTPFSAINPANLRLTNQQIYAHFMPQKNAIFYKRSISTSLTKALKDTPVLTILGPRQSGKSTLAKSFCPQYTYANLDEEATLITALNDPVGFVALLPEKVIIDEVQRAPSLLRAIKVSVDNNRRPGRFVLTGSTNLLMLPQLSDSLAGRMEIIELFPLTESEKEHQEGKFLHSFLKRKLKPEIASSEGKKLLSLVERLLTGGYPEPLTRSRTRAR
ncbi:MAG: AAA family ATPase [Chthoniobacterales bacterium]|nr:AAA family ATPase [Chthoniobacterales bacterium]